MSLVFCRRSPSSHSSEKIIHQKRKYHQTNHHRLASVPVIICLIVALLHDNNISFAAAWMIVPSSYHRRLTRRYSASSSLFRDSYPSRPHHSTSRWYHVHDDDNEKQTVDVGEALRVPPSSKRQNNLSSDDGEQHNINESPFDMDTTKLNLRILLIDNHDSYTYNLYQYISTMTTHPVHVIMNDAYSSYEDFIISLGSSSTSPTTTCNTNNDNSSITYHNNDNTQQLDQYFDCIILSPGPGQPSHAADMGIVLEVIRRNDKLPILGVCLGHQALGYVYGKEVKLSPCGPVHGLMSSVVFNESRSSFDDHDDGYETITQEDTPTCQLFRGLPQEFNVVRYHSLVVDFSTTTDNKDGDDSSEIEPIAWCTGINESNPDCTRHNICMALRHKRYPHYGVQFHPESIGTGIAGYTLLRNFCEFAHQWRSAHGDKEFEMDSISEGGLHAHESNREKDVQTADNSDASTRQSKYRVFIHKVAPDATIESLPSPKQVFEALYSSRATSFWLDSSTGEAHNENNRNNNNNDKIEGCPIASNSRFSIMGSDDGPLSRNIQYFGREHDIQRRGLRVISSLGIEDVTLEEDILSYLRRRLVEEHEFVDRADAVTFDDSSGVGYKLSPTKEFGEGVDHHFPFDYRGGYVGYLGYEVRHDTQCWILEQEGAGCPVRTVDTSSDVTANPNIPTAAFLFAARSLLYDHQTRDWYIIGIAENDGMSDGTTVDRMSTTDHAEGDVISWIQDMKSKIESIGANGKVAKPSSIFSVANDVVFVPNRSKCQYISDIARSHEEIRNGESYELCVTNQLEAAIELPRQSAKARHESPYDLYRLLRENNPAPFSAFMNFHDDAASVSICCSSPERFLSVKKVQQSSHRRTTTPHYVPRKQFVVESKPIKGTAARYTGSNSEVESEEQVKKTDSELAAKLSKSVKDRAENLMIVDLLRNDLGRVCMVGSVHVPKLMHIETYATVHQMVSTVRGTLDGDTSNAIDVLEACFPGGSMTGAPKQRTMEILNEIEQGVTRGPYSGCLGYISLNGSMDMNIIIRSAVLTPGDNLVEEDIVETWKANIGCGGAITALSNSDNEYNEMLIKSAVVRRSISEWVAKVTADRLPN